jgi:enoyl-CoA hydratase/carnithine racemase
MMPTAGDAHIRVLADRGVCCITIDRPAKRNAITQGMYAAMADAFEQATRDASIGAVLLHGQPDCFTAGNDLADFTNTGSRRDRAGHRFLHAIAGCTKPIVAAVGGHAVGIGTTMLLHCDFVLASPTAQFRLPFVPLGLCPEGGSSMLLPQLAGMRLASKLLLLGDPFDAATAVEAGIVTEIVPEAVLLEHGSALAQRLAGLPRDALLASKALLKGTLGRTAIQAIEDEYPTFERLLASPEAQAIIRGILERRPAHDG